MNATERFASHALETPFSSMSSEAVAAAKIFILDSIGVGIAGAKAPLADGILKTARQWGASGADVAHVWAHKEALPAPSAAFVNGFQIHCQEYDCVHEPAVVHPMATILSALMAEAERKGGVTGADFLAAIIVAVDIAAGLGVAVTSPIRFFRPANAGLFGATLGIARLRGFTQEMALDALGYALAHCSGTMQSHIEGKPALPVQIGNAARAAHFACDLAAAGIGGPHDVFEGPYGYFSLFEEAWDLAPVLAALGKVWRITEVSHKPFPTGRAAQGGIVAIQKLRADGVTAENLDRLELTAPPLIKRLVGRAAKADMAVNYARLCFAYSGAVALLEGTVGLDAFSSKRLRDPALHRLAGRISIIDNGSTNPAAFTPQTAKAVLKDDAVKSVTIDALYGSPANPLSEEAHIQKFRDCAAFGFGQPDLQRTDALISFVDNLESEADAGRLGRLAAGF